MKSIAENMGVENISRVNYLISVGRQPNLDAIALVTELDWIFVKPSPSGRDI